MRRLINLINRLTRKGSVGDWIATIALIVFVIGLIIGLAAAVPSLAAILLRYVLGAFDVEIGFWPCFAMVWLFFILAGGFSVRLRRRSDD